MGEEGCFCVCPYWMWCQQNKKTVKVNWFCVLTFLNIGEARNKKIIFFVGHPVEHAVSSWRTLGPWRGWGGGNFFFRHRIGWFFWGGVGWMLISLQQWLTPSVRNWNTASRFFKKTIWNLNEQEREASCPTNHALSINFVLSLDSETLLISTDWAYKSANVDRFQLSLHTANHCWLLGGKRGGKTLFLS